MKSPAAPGPRYSATLQLLRTADTLWDSGRLLFARWDLSPSQFNVLNLLTGQPDGLSQIALSRELIMHRSNVTGLVDRLQARGLVQRREVPEDRRAYRVALTPLGRRLMDDILPYYYEAAEAVWGSISPAAARQLAGTLEIVGDNARRVARRMAAPPSGADTETHNAYEDGTRVGQPTGGQDP